jgi:hypothetical protein
VVASSQPLPSNRSPMVSKIKQNCVWGRILPPQGFKPLHSNHQFS